MYCERIVNDVVSKHAVLTHVHAAYRITNESRCFKTILPLTCIERCDPDSRSLWSNKHFDLFGESGEQVELFPRKEFGTELIPCDVG